MLGGSQSYGLWIPVDGTWYDFENIECLGLPAYALGDCNDITVDQIGVVAGNGPCSFVGNAGWAGTLQGKPEKATTRSDLLKPSFAENVATSPHEWSP